MTADKAKAIIRNNLYMTISVSSRNGFPWIANIYFAYDKNYNFYWYSPKDSRHSRMLQTNPKIAIAIFDSTAVGDDVDAVYIEAIAYEIVKGKELITGIMTYGKKMLQTKFVNSKQAYEKFISSTKDFKKKSPLRMYKAIPLRLWKLAPSQNYNDKFVDSRIEIGLAC